MRFFIFYKVDLAIPTAITMPKREIILYHVFPDLSIIVMYTIVHINWTMVWGLVARLISRI